MTFDRIAAIVALAAGVCAVATFVLNRRDRTRLVAGEVFAIVDKFSTQPSSDAETLVTVHNNSDYPIHSVQVALHEWGKRRRLWRLRTRSEVWTGERREASVYTTILPNSATESDRMDGVSTPRRGDLTDFDPPPVILWFRDGFGRKWVRWPDGRLSRVRL